MRLSDIAAYRSRSKGVVPLLALALGLTPLHQCRPAELVAVKSLIMTCVQLSTDLLYNKLLVCDLISGLISETLISRALAGRPFQSQYVARII